MKYYLLVLALFFIACNGKNKSSTETVITSSIDSVLSNNRFNGVILVTQNEKTIYEKAIGVTDLKTRNPLKIDNQFFIGSISKQITAVLILQEVEKGRINLTDTISNYLTEINQTWAKEITIHHLLTHTHGITSLSEPLAFEVGTKFQYSQLGYGLLANILEHINDASFEAITTGFFIKNGLSNTFHPKNKKYEQLVKGYEQAEDGSFHFSENSLVDYIAAGGFISTVKDLNHWNNLLFSGQLVSKESLQLMKTKYATRKHPIFDQVEYGYGLLFKDGEADIQIGALGYTPGFVSACYYYPQTNLNLIVLENTAKDLNNFKNTFKVHTELMHIIKNRKN